MVTDLLPLFKGLGFEADLLVLKETDSQFARELKSRGIEVYDTGLNNEYSLRQVFRLASFMKKNSSRYSLIHAHLFPTQYWLVLAQLLSGKTIPLVTTEHNTHNRRRGRFIFKIPERYVYSRYARVICISEPAETNLLRWLPSLEAKTVVVPNGVSLERFQKAEGYFKQDLPVLLNENDKIILMVASLSRQKDHGTVIRAVKRLPEQYKVFFVGDGPQAESLTALVEELGLTNRVHFLGARNDVERLIKSADLFVLSSHWEGFGLVVVEAMAGGLPVVAANVQGLAEIVGEAGLLFTAGDDRELAGYIEKVLSSEGVYRQLVEVGAKKAEKYALEHTAAGYAEIYKSLLINHGI